MNTDEKQEMLKMLATGRDALTAAVAGTTEDLAGRSPGPGRWSVLQCVEHVSVAEDYLYSQITSSQPAEKPIIRKLREAAIRERGLDRTRTVQSPSEAIPTGRFHSLADALQHFLAGREQTMRFVEACPDDLRARLTTHPIIGSVNCYEMLLMMAVHPLRHAKQIEEIRATR